jgi:hypothetical protein
VAIAPVVEVISTAKARSAAALVAANATAGAKARSVVALVAVRAIAKAIRAISVSAEEVSAEDDWTHFHPPPFPA